MILFSFRAKSQTNSTSENTKWMNCTAPRAYGQHAQCREHTVGSAAFWHVLRPATTNVKATPAMGARQTTASSDRDDN